MAEREVGKEKRRNGKGSRLHFHMAGRKKGKGWRLMEGKREEKGRTSLYHHRGRGEEGGERKGKGMGDGGRETTSLYRHFDGGEEGELKLKGKGERERGRGGGRGGGWLGLSSLIKLVHVVPQTSSHYILAREMTLQHCLLPRHKIK